MNKKIYSNLNTFFVCLVFIVCSYFLRVEFGVWIYIWMCFCSLGILVGLITYFVPFYRYGEEGICVKFGNQFFINYRWKDVNSIRSFPTLASHFTWISMEDKGGVILLPWITRNYFDVLGDIVKFVQTQNTRATIDSLTLEKLKKREVLAKF
jgi:hypothetical protein